jgi:hypothetical protein
MGASTHPRGRHRLPSLTLLTLVVVAALAVAAPAMAFDPIPFVCNGGANAMHGDGTLNTTCAVCHGGNPNPVPPVAPVDTKVCGNSCHFGGYENRVAPSLFTKCWSCHAPGETQDAVQSSAGCAAATACHTLDPAKNLPHYGANTKGCLDGCHRTSSQSVPNGSPHHDDGLASCYDCHDGAQALEKAHEPYADPRDLASGGHVCQLCHVGYATVHPDPATIVHRKLDFTSTPLTVVYGSLTGTVPSGRLLLPSGAGQGDQQVYVQAKPVLGLDFVKLATPTLIKTATSGTVGAFSVPAQFPTSIISYRVYVKGLDKTATTGVMKPVMASVLVKVRPNLKMNLSTTSFLLGKTVTVSGTIDPPRPGGTVKLTFQKYTLGAWKTVLTKTVPFILPDGKAYKYAYKPASKGTYRVKASVVATPELIAYTTANKTFTVK